MRRDLFTPDQELFRETVAKFLHREAVPHHEQWERDGIVPRSVWERAGSVGLLGLGIPDEYGGSGTTDFRFNTAVTEEVCRAGVPGLGFSLQNDIIAPYLVQLTTEEQRQRWLPGFASGELIGAIAMTEPEAGSDLQGIQTTAIRDGNDYVLNGRKTFISNGINADLVLVVARTDPDAGAHGISLLAVERDTPGFQRGRNLDKIGLKAQDTAELFFSDTRVPATNLVGTENQGFMHLMQNLPQERLSIAVSAVASAEAVLDQTISYCRERTAFGRSLSRFQNTRFVLAELATELDIARTYVDRAVTLLNENELTAADAAKAKWWTTELCNRVMDRCLQLHGGYGYMMEYPVARAWQDARIQTIFGGTTEIMKEIVGRSLEL
ncbi:acyl-CoA dehydrogenase family protein [Lipingzhangella sp. LS1_29]|uniref:Acyl-[acyl-carrier-protein] dehydrogenase MbtN n=1 Tax=Lipingzhangella rawalii TaxID=2055835 RepID=A0ABU2H4E7_9ACTN|nr:acyl-CoA dehydrogenase family protein [Lipingzhangella rawalii]MDS1270168.1 acyl-CoA dehydrogenase family protein [Lipingzhangella rawalii]